MAQVLAPPAGGNGQVHDFDDSTGVGNDAAASVNGCTGSLGAALFDLLPILPMIASVATVFAYVGGPKLELLWFELDLQHVPLVTGIVATAIVGGLAMRVSRDLNTSAELVHPQSYAELRHRADRLKARLHILTERCAARSSATEAMALEEAEVYRQALVKGLSRSGPQWVLGTGYLGLYARLHRAEEALFMVEPTAEVQAAALYDELRVKGSAIIDSENLVVRIRAAVQVLSFAAQRHPNSSPPAPFARASSAAPSPAALPTADDTGTSAAATAPGITAATTVSTASAPVSGLPSTVTEARATLREIRRLINEFRDERREALVRSRCRLLGTTTVTGLITYVLLAFTVNLDSVTGAVAGVAAADAVVEAVKETATNPDVYKAAADSAEAVKTAAEKAAQMSATRVSMIAATTIYLVGAAVGLFNRLYLESGDDAAGEDYGLSRSRLVLTPILSGLAAVGGVLITAMLMTVVDGNRMAPLIDRPPTKQQIGSPAAGGPQPLIPTVGASSRAPVPGDSQPPEPVPTPSGSLPADRETGVDRRPPLRPADVFNLEGHPFSIVLAAIFGLTPGLFLDRLKRASEQPKADLKSTEAHRLDPAASKA